MTSKTHCQVLYNSLSIDPRGTVKPCCIFDGYITDDDGHKYYVQQTDPTTILASNYMSRLREIVESGNQIPQCAVCYDDESRGYRSKRIQDNFILRGNGTVPKLTHLQVSLSNLCNFACITCSPDCSTMWMTELKLNSIALKDKGQAGAKTGLFWLHREDWYKDLRNLQIQGGEPSLSAQWKTILTELVKNNKSKNIDVSMNTNGSSEILSFRSLAPHFKHFQLSISIDGVGKQFNYIRYHGDWDSVNEIVKQLKTEANFCIGIVCTVTWLNLWYLPEIHEACQGTSVWFNQLTIPEHLNVKCMPPKLRKATIEKLKNYDFGSNCADVNAIVAIITQSEYSNELFQESVKYLNNLDLRRGTNFKESFSEIIEFIDNLE